MSNILVLAGGSVKGAFQAGVMKALMEKGLVKMKNFANSKNRFGYVYVLGQGDRVRRLRVGTGRRLGDRIEVTSGLAAGARIANDGAGFLNDGDKVRVVTTGGRAK